MALLRTVAVSPRSTPTHTMAAPANSKPTCAIVFFDCGNLLTPFIAALLYHRRCKIFVKNRKLTEILSACAIMNTNGSLSVSKKPFRHAWSRNTPSAQPVSVRFAPENREPSSKRARFLRHWRRVARFPLLGYLRAKSRLRRLRSDTRLRAQPLGGSLYCIVIFRVVSSTRSMWMRRGFSKSSSSAQFSLHSQATTAPMSR